MTAYRFRVKFDPDPTSLWRDVVVGADSTIVEFQSVISGFHLWRKTMDICDKSFVQSYLGSKVSPRLHEEDKPSP